jgi:hypothetical protein
MGVRTMLRLNDTQRGLLAEKLCDAGNLVAGALLLGQFVGERSFSATLGTIGVAGWIGLMAFALWVGSDGRSR